MDPRTLSHQLRKETTPDLTRRRWIVGLNLLGVSMGQLVSLYQMGIISRLPDPPGTLFNATKVDASTYAWAMIVTVLATAVSALLVRRRLDRLDLIAVLKTRE